MKAAEATIKRVVTVLLIRPTYLSYLPRRRGP